MCQYSDAQGCKLLTDLSFTFYLPKLGHLKPLATLGFIFELFDSFKLFKMEQDNQMGDRNGAEKILTFLLRFLAFLAAGSSMWSAPGDAGRSGSGTSAACGSCKDGVPRSTSLDCGCCRFPLLPC